MKISDLMMVTNHPFEFGNDIKDAFVSSFDTGVRDGLSYFGACIKAGLKARKDVGITDDNIRTDIEANSLQD